MPSSLFSKILIVSQGILMNNDTAEDNIAGQCTLTNHSRKVQYWNDAFSLLITSLIFREPTLSEYKYLKL